MPRWEKIDVLIISRKKGYTPANKYVGFYDFYLGNQAEHIDESLRVSDMHYHESMKAHNAYGQHFYKDLKNPIQPPTNLNWLKIHNKLVVYDKVNGRNILKKDVSSNSDKRKMKFF